MFSHGLVGYMNALMQFSKKASETLDLISSVISIKKQYEFTVLKDLRQEGEITLNEQKEGIPIETQQTMLKLDNDQQLFFLSVSILSCISIKLLNFKLNFQDDFLDHEKQNDDENKHSLIVNQNQSHPLLNIYTDDEKCDKCIHHNSKTSEASTYDDFLNEIFPATLLEDKPNTDLLTLTPNSTTILSIQSNILLENQATLSLSMNDNKPNNKQLSKDPEEKNKESSKLSSWFELFADLDPLANLELAKKINGDKAYSEDV